ncbi:BOI-related E3 ubiquitin-protein ligase 1 [Ananas comosus]|uniref:BOI-related E3 ubiquitin-protein ligase 1 n=1 Tax=Ananas comosus TaxID=4615 RepID=A0A199UMH1_ANACO|nr:BOI-related E3 ubiquitin-protein ligase 1 [Ananas comosus]
MAVQAQCYPSEALFLTRGEREKNGVELPQPPSSFLDPSPTVFFSNGGGVSLFWAARGRKRARDDAAAAAGAAAPPPFPATATMMSLAQLQNQAPPPPLVSTGLRLAFEDQQQQQQQQQQQKQKQSAKQASNPILSTSSSNSSSLFASPLVSDEVAAQIKQHKDEIEQFVSAQTEQLRRAVGERWRRQQRALLATAEAAAARRLQEKEAEAERAARQGAELEDRLARLRAESMAWQAKALAEQAAAASLHNQLQQATAAAAAAAAAAADERGGDAGPAEDAASAYVDPERVEPERACRACGLAAATVVLLPCRHLCLCAACDAAALACPACGFGRTGSVQVLFS